MSMSPFYWGARNWLHHSRHGLTSAECFVCVFLLWLPFLFLFPPLLTTKWKMKVEAKGRDEWSVPPTRLLQGALNLSATFPFVRQQWEGGKEASHRTWLLSILRAPSPDEICKFIVGLGFSLFPSEGNGHGNDLLPGNALIDLMLHEAVYLSDVSQHGLQKKNITYQEYLSSSMPYSFTLQVLILKKKSLFFSEEFE